MVTAVEFLAKQGLLFSAHCDDKVDFACKVANRGNFIATLQLFAKENAILKKHLEQGKRNSRYTSKTTQNEIIHIYASKIREKMTTNLRSQGLPFTIIADECTDPHSNTEILSVCLRFVDITLSQEPHIKDCLFSFSHLERANASAISL